MDFSVQDLTVGLGTGHLKTGAPCRTWGVLILVILLIKITTYNDGSRHTGKNNSSKNKGIRRSGSNGGRWW